MVSVASVEIEIKLILVSWAFCECSCLLFCDPVTYIKWGYMILCDTLSISYIHDDIMAWKCSPHYWPSVWGNHGPSDISGFPQQRDSDEVLFAFMLLASTSCYINSWVANIFEMPWHLCDGSNELRSVIGIEQPRHCGLQLDMICFQVSVVIDDFKYIFTGQITSIEMTWGPLYWHG